MRIPIACLKHKKAHITPVNSKKSKFELSQERAFQAKNRHRQESEAPTILMNPDIQMLLGRMVFESFEQAVLTQLDRILEKVANGFASSFNLCPEMIYHLEDAFRMACCISPTTVHLIAVSYTHLTLPTKRIV